MEKQKVDLYLTANAKYFDPAKLSIIRTKLESLSDESFIQVQSVELKDPTVLLLVSIFLGSLGIDRFMIGEMGMGLLKLLTCGLCGILTIIDWFTIQQKTRERNFAELCKYI